MAEIALNDLGPEMRSLYAKAVEAVKRQNYDYAVTLLNQILAQEPGLFECRQVLRRVQVRKCAATRRGFFKKVLNSAGSSPQIARAKLALHKHPSEAMAIAETVLNGDPNSPFAHRVIVEAAQALGLPQTLAMSLEALVKHSPNDKSLVIEFANTIIELGLHADAAEKYLDELVRTSRYDPDLLQAQKNLAAYKTLDEGGGIGAETEARLGRRLAAAHQAKSNAPEVKSVLRLVEDDTAAPRSFQAGSGSVLEGGEGSDDTNLETKSRHLDLQIAQLNPAASDYAQRVAQIQSEKQAFQLAECQRRAAKYPTDLTIRFELGQFYFQAGKISEAIGELQKAQQNPHQRIAAMNLLGQCFVRRNMNDLAVRTFQKAIKEKAVLDAEKKDLIYHLGCIFEKMGKTTEAVEQFQVIYEADINYRDVSAKVDAHYANMT